MFRSALSFALVALSAAALPACSSSDSNTSNGSAPVIAQFELAESEIEAGKASTLEADLTFEDADGDLATLQGSFDSAERTLGTIQEQSISDLAGKTTADLKLTLPLPKLEAGDYTISLWLTDAAGNVSPKKTASLTAK